jgi:hypothetical protein
MAGNVRFGATPSAGQPLGAISSAVWSRGADHWRSRVRMLGGLLSSSVISVGSAVSRTASGRVVVLPKLKSSERHWRWCPAGSPSPFASPQPQPPAPAPAPWSQKPYRVSHAPSEQA